MWRCIRHGLLVGALMEVGFQALALTKLVVSVPGVVLLGMWCIDAIYWYAAWRDRRDGRLGGAVAGVMLGGFFAVLTLVLASLYGRSGVMLPSFTFLFSLALGGLTDLARAEKEARGQRPGTQKPD